MRMVSLDGSHRLEGQIGVGIGDVPDWSRYWRRSRLEAVLETFQRWCQFVAGWGGGGVLAQYTESRYGLSAVIVIWGVERCKSRIIILCCLTRALVGSDYNAT